MENKGAIGKITQVISAVLDIKFPEGHLPEINDAIRIPLKKGGELIVEELEQAKAIEALAKCKCIFIEPILCTVTIENIMAEITGCNKQ